MTERIVYTGGTFDLLHPGHTNFLRQCKRIAGPEGKVIVGLNTDDFVSEYKGRPPVLSYEERLELLLSLVYVDGVVRNVGGKDSKPVILSVAPQFIVVGSDWACKDYYSQMGFTQKWLDDNGITLIYVPYTQGISTTEIKRRIHDGNGSSNEPQQSTGFARYISQPLSADKKTE